MLNNIQQNLDRCIKIPYLCISYPENNLFTLNKANTNVEESSCEATLFLFVIVNVPKADLACRFCAGQTFGLQVFGKILCLNEKFS